MVDELGEDELLAPSAPLKVDVVDDEVAESQSQAIVHHLVPSLASPIVEHDVSGDVDALCCWVEDAVGLDALRVADEDSRHAPIVELADVVELLGESEVAEHAEVAHHLLMPMPSLIRRLAVKGLSGRVVEEMDGSHHRLSVVDGRHPSLLEEGTGGGHHSLVAALHNAVLLWGVRRGEVALDPLIGAVRLELSRRELATIVVA